MTAVLHLGPGERAPGWIEAIEKACFGDAWGTLDECEHVWAVPPAGFARWRILAEVQEAELLRIGVAADCRRQGHARALLRLSQEELVRMGVTEAFLEVRVSNAAARALYEAEGWAWRGVRKSYYRDGEAAALYSRMFT